jgi:hypothetical protein
MSAGEGRPVGVEVRPGPESCGEYTAAGGGPGGSGPDSILFVRGEVGRSFISTGERLGGGGGGGPKRVGERAGFALFGYADEDDEGLGGGRGLGRGGESPSEF